MNTQYDSTPSARPEDAAEFLPEILSQEDPNGSGEDICEVMDWMMSRDIAAIEQEVNKEIEDNLAGKAGSAIPKKEGHMSEQDAVKVLQQYVSALHEVMEKKHSRITPENLGKFHTYEDRALRKIKSAESHAAEAEKRRKTERDTRGSFRADDRRAEGI